MVLRHSCFWGQKIVEYGLPMHQPGCNNKRPCNCCCQSRFGWARYADRKTRGWRRASTDANWAALRDAFFFTTALLALDVSQFPYPSARGAFAPPATHDRPNVQRTELRFHGVHRRARASAGDRNGRASSSDFRRKLACQAACGERTIAGRGSAAAVIFEVLAQKLSLPILQDSDFESLDRPCLLGYGRTARTPRSTKVY